MASIDKDYSRVRRRSSQKGESSVRCGRGGGGLGIAENDSCRDLPSCPPNLGTVVCSPEACLCSAPIFASPGRMTESPWATCTASPFLQGSFEGYPINIGKAATISPKFGKPWNFLSLAPLGFRRQQRFGENLESQQHGLLHEALRS